MRGWSERRRALWRWGWAALVAGVLFCPVGIVGACSDGDDGGRCETSYASLAGLATGIGY